MENLQDVLKALADETRFKILELLLEQDFCVGALAANLRISRAAVSQHLQILRNAELVKGEKRGYWTHYVVNRETVENTAAVLNKMAAMSGGYKYKCMRGHFDKNNVTEGVIRTICQCSCCNPEKLRDKPGKCCPKPGQDCLRDQKKHPFKKDETNN